jgi:hypothetical protein
MVKGSFSLGFLIGADVSASIGFNGVKASFAMGGGSFGKVSGPFPRQQAVFGAGPSVALGMGKQ